MDKYLAELLGTFLHSVWRYCGSKKIRLFNKSPLKSQDFSDTIFLHVSHGRMQIIALKNAYKNGFSISSRSSRWIFFWQVLRVFQLLYHIIQKSLQGFGHFSPCWSSVICKLPYRLTQSRSFSKVRSWMAWDSLPFSNALNISSSPVFVIFNERLMSMLPNPGFFSKLISTAAKYIATRHQSAVSQWHLALHCLSHRQSQRRSKLLEPEDLNSRCNACRFSSETSSAHWLSASQLEYSIFWLAFYGISGQWQLIGIALLLFGKLREQVNSKLFFQIARHLTIRTLSELSVGA